jgi:hypothetical protein
MTLADTVTALSERWLRDRTFELVVAPAIADLQFDDAATGLRRTRNLAAVLSAFVWGMYEDLTSDVGSLVTFVGLTLIPACYYTLLLMICAPLGELPVGALNSRLVVGLAILVLSLGPAIACYWPERPAPRMRADAMKGNS